jgi:hypothetical protein
MSIFASTAFWNLQPVAEGPVGPVTLDYLIVAGGGAGGGERSGGGGAGGLLSGSFSPSIQAYTITIGAGGPNPGAVQDGASGNNTTALGFTAIGGGGGGASVPGSTGAKSGGSGGGAGDYGNGALRTQPGSGSFGPPIQGYPGGNGLYLGSPQTLSAGGGGGASATGSAAVAAVNSGGAGGDGKQSSIRGTLVYYAGGGGGGRSYPGSNVRAPGGQGGGGASGVDSASANAATGNGVAGTANTGGGGGGASWGGSRVGAGGGSGIVVIRYLASSMTATGGTETTDGAYKVHSFTSSGTFTRTA